MVNFDDFDLDVRKIKGNTEVEPKATTPIYTTLMTAMTCTMPAVCDTSAATVSCDVTCWGCTATQADCSADTCSACHSYCGGACRR